MASKQIILLFAAVGIIVGTTVAVTTSQQNALIIPTLDLQGVAINGSPLLGSTTAGGIPVHIFSASQAAEGAVLKADDHNIFTCAMGGPLLSAEQESDTVTRFWGYEYTGNEVQNKRDGKAGRQLFDGQFFISQGELNASPGQYDHLNELTGITGATSYYFMAEQDLYVKCGEGMRLAGEEDTNPPESSSSTSSSPPTGTSGLLHFSSILDGPQAPTTSTVTGSSVYTLDTDTRELTYFIVYGSFPTAETVAHFHGPASPGEDAGAIITLPEGNPKSGSVLLTEEQMQQLLDGLWYVNIHTQEYPEGEIRGQVLPGPLANLYVTQEAVEVFPLVTGTTGTGPVLRLRLTAEHQDVLLTRLFFRVSHDTDVTPDPLSSIPAPLRTLLLYDEADPDTPLGSAYASTPFVPVCEESFAFEDGTINALTSMCHFSTDEHFEGILISPSSPVFLSLVPVLAPQFISDFPDLRVRVEVFPFFEARTHETQEPLTQNNEGNVVRGEILVGTMVPGPNVLVSGEVFPVVSTSTSSSPSSSSPPSETYTVTLTSDPEAVDGSVHINIGDTVLFTRHEEGAGDVINNAFQWNWDSSLLQCAAVPDFDSPDFQCTAIASGSSLVSITTFPVMSDGTGATVYSNEISVEISVRVGLSCPETQYCYAPGVSWIDCYQLIDGEHVAVPSIDEGTACEIAGGTCHSCPPYDPTSSSSSFSSISPLPCVRCADVNRNGAVTTGDVGLVASRIGACLGDPDYDPIYDINDDGCITEEDRQCVTDAVGTSPVCDDAAVCGNGIVEAGEQCDDGNEIDGDGCFSNCTLMIPPNSLP